MGATLASGMEADAAIMYNPDPNRSVQILNTIVGSTYFVQSNTIGIDIDGVNGDDFRLIAELSQSQFTSNTAVTSFAFVAKARFRGILGVNRIQSIGPTGHIARLNYGDAINGARDFAFGDGSFAEATSFLASNGEGGDNFTENWANGQTGFIGLHILYVSDVHYGWARIELIITSVTGGQGDVSFRVIDLAYESDANTGLTAGAIPEPSSLGMLAMGATGLYALRRRRKDEE